MFAGEVVYSFIALRRLPQLTPWNWSAAAGIAREEGGGGMGTLHGYIHAYVEIAVYSVRG